jgi:ribosomal protein S6
MSEENIKQHERQDGIQVYELAFHLVPTLSEDEVMVQFSHLKSLIEKKGGTFISEETPQMTNLAYEISKTVKAQKKHYTSSFFGWVKFELNPEEIAGLEKQVKGFEPMLRYLLITTVRENTLFVPRERKVAKEDAEAGTDEVTDEVATVESTEALPTEEASA